MHLSGFTFMLKDLFKMKTLYYFHSREWGLFACNVYINKETGITKFKFRFLVGHGGD